MRAQAKLTNNGNDNDGVDNNNNDNNNNDNNNNNNNNNNCGSLELLIRSFTRIQCFSYINLVLANTAEAMNTVTKLCDLTRNVLIFFYRLFSRFCTETQTTNFYPFFYSRYNNNNDKKDIIILIIKKLT